MRIILLFLCLTTSVMARETIIYGEDNRVDIINVLNPMIKQYGQSVAGRVMNFKLSETEDSKISLGRPQTLSSPWGLNICSDEKFANQPTVADCTGFLVGEDLLVTAGHCVTDAGSTIENDTNRHCDNYSWVFDIKLDGHENVKLENISKDNVYGCSKVIYATHQPVLDFAIIKLDRKVVGRKPLKLKASSSKILENEKVYVIGHPSGLPLKYADGAKVFSSHEDFFSTNLDTFGGNSGSPVFNAETNEVEGILVRGDIDYAMANLDGKSCRRVNKCDSNRENCQQDNPQIDGEHVTVISKVLEYL